MEHLKRIHDAQIANQQSIYNQYLIQQQQQRQQQQQQQQQPMTHSEAYNIMMKHSGKSYPYPSPAMPNHLTKSVPSQVVLNPYLARNHPVPDSGAMNLPYVAFAANPLAAQLTNQQQQSTTAAASNGQTVGQPLASMSTLAEFNANNLPNSIPTMSPCVGKPMTRFRQQVRLPNAELDSPKQPNLASSHLNYASPTIPIHSAFKCKIADASRSLTKLNGVYGTELKPGKIRPPLVANTVVSVADTVAVSSHSSSQLPYRQPLASPMKSLILNQGPRPIRPLRPLQTSDRPSTASTNSEYSISSLLTRSDPKPVPYPIQRAGKQTVQTTPRPTIYPIRPVQQPCSGKLDSNVAKQAVKSGALNSSASLWVANASDGCNKIPSSRHTDVYASCILTKCQPDTVQIEALDFSMPAMQKLAKEKTANSVQSTEIPQRLDTMSKAVLTNHNVVSKAMIQSVSGIYDTKPKCNKGKEVPEVVPRFLRNVINDTLSESLLKCDQRFAATFYSLFPNFNVLN